MATDACVEVENRDKDTEKSSETVDLSREEAPSTSSTDDVYVYQLPSGEDISRAGQKLRSQEGPPKGRIGHKRLVPTCSAEEAQLVDSLRRDRAQLLSRIGSYKPLDVLHALWDDQQQRVVVTKHKGAYLQFMGQKVGDRTVLHPLETLFLLEANQLSLMWHGVPVSISEGYELLLDDRDDFDRYLVYSYLMRAGYIVIPYRKTEASEATASSVPDSPAKTTPKVEKHDSDDDVVCLDDSDDSDISIVEVIPAKYPKLDPSITVTVVKTPEKVPPPVVERRSSKSDDNLSFPKYVPGQTLTLRRPPAHLLPQNVRPSREWYEVSPDCWKGDESVEERRRNGGRYGDRGGRFSKNSSGEKSNGQFRQHATPGAWTPLHLPPPRNVAEQRGDAQPWNNAEARNCGPGVLPLPPWANAPRPLFNPSQQLQPWWQGGPHPPHPWSNAANSQGAAGLERPPLRQWPNQPWLGLPSPALLHGPPPLLPAQPPWNAKDGGPSFQGTGVWEQGWQAHRAWPNPSPPQSGPGRPGWANPAAYRRGPLRNDGSRGGSSRPGRPFRPSWLRRHQGGAGASGSSESGEEEYPSVLPRLSGKESSWAELKSGAAHLERMEALLAGEGAVLWKGSVQPLVVPTRDLSITGIVSQLSVLEEVDLVNGSQRPPCGDAHPRGETTEPDLDVYLPGTAYSKRNPGLPECRVCVLRWDSGRARLRDLVRRQVTPSDDVPLVFAAVDHGQVQLFAFDTVVAPRFVPGP